MAELSIHNIEHLLKELRKNVTTINTLLQQVGIVLNNSHSTCTAMHMTCLEWQRNLDKS